MMRFKWRNETGWQDRAEAFLRESLPLDFPPEVPIYLVAAKDVADLPPSRSAAFTSSVLDLTLREHIGPRWRGRGFCSVVHTEKIDDEWQLLGAILHEATHYVEWLVDLGSRGASDLGMMVQSVENMSSETLEYANQFIGGMDPTPKPDAQLWAGHGLFFTWAACHAGYRGWQYGDLCDAWRLMNFAGPFYGLSSFADYLRAANDAPREMAELSLLEAVARGPCSAFLELFVEDTNHENDKLATKTEQRRRGNLLQVDCAGQ